MAAPLAELLDWLFAAKIESSDAFACAKALLEAGISSREQIRQLSPQRAKELTPKKTHAKIVRALKQMPTLEKEGEGESARGVKRKRGPPDLGPAPPPPSSEGELRWTEVIVVNRSPVMILWAAAVGVAALNLDWSEALSVASAAAALFARAKGRKLGLYSSGGPRQSQEGSVSLQLLGDEVPVVQTSHGLRGLAVPYTSSEGAEHELAPVAPIVVHRSLSNAFGEHMCAAWQAMLSLASAVPANALQERRGQLAYNLYAEFRPHVPDGLQGWGQPGRLELKLLLEIRKRYSQDATVPLQSTPPAIQTSTATMSQIIKNEESQGATTKLPPSARPHGSSESIGAAAALPVVKSESNIDSDAAPTQKHAQSSCDGEAAGTSDAPTACKIIDLVRNGNNTLPLLCQALACNSEPILPIVEELQLDGVLYERDGALYLL